MGFVYLIGEFGNDNIYKIGVTNGKIENRIKKMQTGNSDEIYLVDSYETEYPFIMEKMLHTKYFPNKKKGEWFELKNEDVINFRETCENMQKNINSLKENYFFNKKYNKNFDYE